MRSLRTPPTPAQPADLLTAELRARIRALARLVGPDRPALDASFLAWLGRRGYGPQQKKAMAAITFGAAADLLSRRKPLDAFFEQVDYNGRRLAKLDVEPAEVLSALSVYDRLLAPRIRSRAGDRAGDMQQVSRQLNFGVVLALNNAFYDVRENETDAFFDLHDVGLNANTAGELLGSHMEVLRRYCRADATAGALLGRDPSSAIFAGDAEPAGAGALKELRDPRSFHSADGGGKLLLASAWRGTYRCVWSVPFAAGKSAGALQFAFRGEYEWLPREIRLLQAAARRCGALVEKLRLQGELRSREEEVRRLAARVLNAEERERRRISRELHDETGQLLPCLGLQLEEIERSIPEASSAVKAVKEALADAREMIQRTIVEIRRVVADLSPTVLEQLGLRAAVRQCLNRLRQSRCIAVRLDAGRLGPVPKEIETVAYRIVQECCTNVAKHSSAAHLYVSLATADRRLTVRVRDDGVGFRVGDALEKPGSQGLGGMRERVALAGGSFELRSNPGRGTCISIGLPVPAGGVPVRNRVPPQRRTAAARCA